MTLDNIKNINNTLEMKIMVIFVLCNVIALQKRKAIFNLRSNFNVKMLTKQWLTENYLAD